MRANVSMPDYSFRDPYYPTHVGVSYDGPFPQHAQFKSPGAPYDCQSCSQAPQSAHMPVLEGRHFRGLGVSPIAYRYDVLPPQYPPQQYGSPRFHPGAALGQPVPVTWRPPAPLPQQAVVLLRQQLPAQITTTSSPPIPGGATPATPWMPDFRPTFMPPAPEPAPVEKKWHERTGVRVALGVAGVLVIGGVVYAIAK